ncbi:hypothetical protein [Salinicoccus albus]|uniref:hypothetical protein n=1 Tax=Salinicoccus albus TaxID=418756 RepID=UPI000369D61F|nr:hypothetical protein [Salinicoccus albus]
MKKYLYDHRRNCVGEADFIKRNGTVAVTYYKNLIHYADVTLDFTEFDGYKARLGLIDDSELGQMELF